MSLDVTVTMPACSHCGRRDATYNWNYTYNVTHMTCVAAERAGFKHTRMLDGIEGRASNYTATLRAIVEQLRADPETFRAMNPSNGWGDYDSYTRQLEVLLEQLEANPNSIVDTSR